MKKMFFRMAAAAAMAVMCGAANADLPISVGLNISHPKETVSKTGDDKSKNNKNDYYGSSSTEVRNSVFEYTGKVSCNPPKDKTATVTLEAYFITREIGTKGAKDVLGERMEISTYEFGGENPKQYKFELKSPSFSQTTVTEKTGYGRNAKTNKQKTGTRLMGVILRAMVDGKPVKVISEPSNSQWIAAGKKESIELK